jgi:hypothetical protein
MTSDEHNEIHAMLGRQISELAGQVERGFQGVRGDIASMCNRVHERIDTHLETMHAEPVDAPSGVTLPRPFERCRSWMTFILEAGAVIGGLLGVLYLLYKAAELGVFK